VLPAVGPNGSTISWSSNGSPYLWDDGTVIRPPSGADAAVSLTATVSYGEASKTKTFNVIVPSYTSDVRTIAKVLTAPEGEELTSADYVIRVPVRTAPKLPYRVWVEYSDGYGEWRNTQWPWSGSYGSGPAGSGTPAGIEQIWQSYPIGHEYTVTGWITGDNATPLGYPITVHCKVVEGDFTMPTVNGIYAGNDIITSVQNPASFKVPETKVAKTMPITKISLNTEPDNRLTSNVKRSVTQAAFNTQYWEPDMWLYNYRDTFGLSLEGYRAPSGWESPTTKLRGHGAGHYINALALTYNTRVGTPEENEAILEKIKRFVYETRAIQEMTFWPLDWVGRQEGETYEDVLARGETWKNLEVTRWREAADTWPHNETDKALNCPDWPLVTLKDVTSDWDGIKNNQTRERNLNNRDPKWFGYGYINAIPPIHLVLNERYGTYSAWVWAPYYGVHKQLAGFMDCYYSFKDSEDPELRDVAETAFQICKDMCHWISNRLTSKAFHGPTRDTNIPNPKVPDSTYGNLTNTWHTNISGEYGGCNEPMARCAAELDDNDPDKELIIKGAEMFYNKTYWDTLAANSENMSLNGNSHANSRIPQFPGALQTYLLNKDPFYYVVSKNFFDFNAGRFRYYGGNVGNGEWYRAPYTQIANLGNGQINETCCAMNLAKLAKELACFDPDNAEYMDYYERLTFNQLIGSVRQSGGTWGVTYQYAVGPNQSKNFGNVNPGSTCCGGTGVENPSRYIESVYFTSDDTIWVNMLMQVTGEWDDAGYIISQECDWPAEVSKVTMTPIPGKEQKAVAMKIRIPWWATKDVSITLNGEEIAAKYLPSSYVEIPARVWSADDEVIIRQPFQISIDYAPDKYNGYWAGVIFLGPLAMAGTGNWSVQNIEHDLSNIIKLDPVDYPDSAANTPGNNRNVYSASVIGQQDNNYASTLLPDYYRDTNSTKYFQINLIGGQQRLKLFDIIQKAHVLLPEYYSADTFAALKSAMTAAIEVYQNELASQQQIDAQVTAMQTAIDNLIPNSEGKAQLLEAINQALERKAAQEAWASAPNPSIDDRPWAPYGYARMLDKLEEAQAVYADPEATQITVDAAYAALKQELDTMRIGNQYEVEDLDTVKALLTEAESASAGYTKPDALVAAIQYAQETIDIITAGSSTMSEYPPAVAEQRLRDALSLLYAHIALLGKINEAKALKESDYTADTWAALQASITAAISVSSNSASTRSEVDTAFANLIAAIEGLKFVEPAVMLTAPNVVQPDSTFTVTVNLDNLEQGVFADDITLSYDPNVFEYVSAQGANENIHIVREVPINGTIRIIAANVGGVTGESTPVLNLSFKVKSGLQGVSGSIAVTDAKLGVAPEGIIITPHLTSKSIQIAFEEPAVDKSALGALISAVQAIYDAAVEGMENGQYPAAAKAALLTAINAAKAVYQDNDATQAEVDNALNSLQEAKDLFEASIITGSTGDLNKDGAINIGDLAIAAFHYGKTSASEDWNTAKIADVNCDGTIGIEDLAFIALRIIG